MAERADLLELYEAAVHDPVVEVDFIRDTFAALRGRAPLTFREDFSGAASAACEWVRRGPRCRAIGVDIEPAVLDWGRRHRLSRLSAAARKRVKLINANVLHARTERVDAIAALNFSYWVFKERHTMREYFRSTHGALKRGGLLFLDAFGGHDAFREMKERTKHRRFTYIWDQAKYSPVTGDLTCHIHFSFPDGSRLNRAFTYDWRLWTLPELRELLTEAGFRRVTVYWEGDDGKGNGNGEFRPHESGEADAGWVAYLVAEK
jgi:SAM-dependent methyltransferase